MQAVRVNNGLRRLTTADLIGFVTTLVIAIADLLAGNAYERHAALEVKWQALNGI